MPSPPANRPTRFTLGEHDISDADVKVIQSEMLCLFESTKTTYNSGENPYRALFEIVHTTKMVFAALHTPTNTVYNFYLFL